MGDESGVSHMSQTRIDSSVHLLITSVKQFTSTSLLLWFELQIGFREQAQPSSL